MIRLEKSPVMDGVMRQLLESLMEVSSYLSDVAAFNGEILSLPGKGADRYFETLQPASS